MDQNSKATSGKILAHCVAGRPVQVGWSAFYHDDVVVYIANDVQIERTNDAHGLPYFDNKPIVTRIEAKNGQFSAAAKCVTRAKPPAKEARRCQSPTAIHYI